MLPLSAAEELPLSGGLWLNQENTVPVNTSSTLAARGRNAPLANEALNELVSSWLPELYQVRLCTMLAR